MVVVLASGQGTDRALSVSLVTEFSLTIGWSSSKALKALWTNWKYKLRHFSTLGGLGWIKKPRARKRNYFPLFSCCNFDQDQILEKRNHWEKFSWTSTDVTAQGGWQDRVQPWAPQLLTLAQGTAPARSTGCSPKQHLHMEGALLISHENLEKVKQRYLQQGKRREGAAWESHTNASCCSTPSMSPLSKGQGLLSYYTWTLCIS